MPHGFRVIPLIAASALLVAAPSAGAPKRPPDGLVAKCAFSHRASDDPIVHQGQPGLSHGHDFFGNRSTDSRSTARSLRRHGTTCRPPADRSAYWAPTLSYRGRPARPRRARFYYVVVADNPSGVKPHPAGLRVIAGNPDGRNTRTPRFAWTCTGSPVLHTAQIPRCPQGSRLVLKLKFPDCWDGRRLDSPDHQSHMAYGSRGRCPESHPVAVPQLRFEIGYPGRGGRAAQLSSGPAWTTHGDFFNAWEPSELERRLRRCVHLTGACLGGRDSDGQY